MIDKAIFARPAPEAPSAFGIVDRLKFIAVAWVVIFSGFSLAVMAVLEFHGHLH